MTDRPNSVTTPGGAIGGRLARLVADAIIHTRAETSPTLARVGEQIFTNTTNHVSDEVRGVVGGLFRQVAALEAGTPELKALFSSLGTQRGQAWAWIGGTATGAAMGGGLMNLLTNELNPVVLPLIAANPHGILTPSDAAMAALKGLPGPPTWHDEARKGGIDQNRFNALVELNRPHATVDELRALINRQLLSSELAFEVMKVLGYDHQEAQWLLSLRHQPLSPEILAQMWNRDIVDDREGAYLAAKGGVSEQDFRRMTELGGEPPDTTSLILAWRRGIVTEAQVDRALVQGPIRKEWIPVIKGLQEEPLSPSDTASAVTQGYMSQEEGARRAALYGINAEDFRLIVESAGLPPGLEFAGEARNRGLITETEWESMFLQSRIKNRYIPLMRAMRVNLIPAETVRMMYRLGVYPRDAARTTLVGHGFSEVDADAMLALEDIRSTEGTKELSASQVVGLYLDELVSRETALQMLTASGYGTEEAEWRLAMAEVDKMRRYVNAVVTKVKSAYVASRIPVNEAIGLLDQAGIAATQRDAMIDLWDIERDIVTSQLTTAQIQSAVKKGFITSAGAYDRFLGRGYAPNDASILVRLAGGEAPADSGEGA